MIFNRLFFFIIIILSFNFNSVYGQTPVTIIGKVLEENTNIPVEFATITLFENNSKNLINGTTAIEDGTFSIKTTASNFYIEISFIGYGTKTIKSFTTLNNKIDLQTIILNPSQESLDEIVVRAETSQTEFKLDKRVFNVGKDLSSTGASAIEVLNNVPSVNVNIEGEISLRGSEGVQILINGKPSVLAGDEGNALGTITADMIEKIEVITNPSAKYDAQGTSGIINIIIKKSEKKGLNGAVTLNIGSPNSNSIGLSLNKRTEKFNLFSQLGFGLRTFPYERETINQDLVENTSINSKGESEFNEKFANILIGTDYHLNDRNVITLSGSFAYEIEDQSAFTEFDGINDTTNTLTDNWIRDEVTEAINPKIRYELQYKKDFKRHKAQTLLFSALGRYFRKDQESIFEDTIIFGDRENSEQESRTDYKLEEYTFKLDYTHPFLEKYTLETGTQYTINNVSNDFAVLNLVNEIWINDVDFTNIFDLNQNVLALYTTGAYEGDKWGLKLGLRMEKTHIKTLLENTNESNTQQYTNVFPSAHSSYKVSDDFSLQLGYSKRINRPNLRQLNPFSNIRNNFSISEGNPGLQPEFTDSFELTSIHKFKKGSLNFSLYNRYTKDVIEYITTFENDISTASPNNIGTNNTTGFEANWKFNPSKWLTINGDFNFNYFDRKGVFEDISFDFKGNRWTTRLTSKFKLPAQFDFEVSGNYRSDYETLQQRVADVFFADLGLRKKIVKGKIILNLSVRDVFASRINETIISQPDFYLFNKRQRGRFITFGVSYGFGKGEAMQFSGQRR